MNLNIESICKAWRKNRVKNERLGLTKINNQGCIMKIIEYHNANNIVVEFQDEWKETKQTSWNSFKNGMVKNKNHLLHQRLYLEKENINGCLMKIVEYKNETDLVVEFQDKYKAKVHTTFQYFKNGHIRNPYYPSVYGIGIPGNKYKITEIINGKKYTTKEYHAWSNMIKHCYDIKAQEIQSPEAMPL